MMGPASRTSVWIGFSECVEAIVAIDGETYGTRTTTCPVTVTLDFVGPKLSNKNGISLVVGVLGDVLLPNCGGSVEVGKYLLEVFHGVLRTEHGLLT
jgi:hypothetical protein